MNELQRQQYLEALGVESYMPRWVLPLAPQPRRCAAPSPSPSPSPGGETIESKVADTEVTPVKTEEKASVPPQSELETPSQVQLKRDSDPSPSLGSESSQRASTSALESTIQLLDDNPVLSNANDGGQSVMAASEASEATEAVSFTLGAWRISDDLLVVDSRKAELALPVDALLINILSALGYPRVALPKVELVRWPREQSAFIDHSAAAARAMSQAWLSARLESQPVKFLLLFGAEASHYLLPDAVSVSGQAELPSEQTPERTFAACEGKSVRLDEWNCSAFVVPSLVDVLQQPQLKSQLWQTLQPLRLK